MDHSTIERQLQDRLLIIPSTVGEQEEELDDERDALTASLEFDEQYGGHECELRKLPSELRPTPSKKPRTDVELAEAAVLKASEDVIVASTTAEYVR
jgi:predicted outer membrane protein